MSSRWQAVGPGLLWAGAAIGGSHLVQSTRAGAGWGFDLLWAVVLILILKYPFFEFAHRYTASTGESLLHGYRRLGAWALGVFFAIALVSAVINAAAVTIVSASLLGGLLGLSWTLPNLAALVFGLVAVILVGGRYRTLDRAMKAMISVLAVLTLAGVAVALRHGPAGDLAAAPRPAVWDAAGVAFLLALMGWMPAPLDIAVWSSLWTLAKNRADHRQVSVADSRFDYHVGYVVTGVLAVAFVSFGALVMFGTGEAFADNGIVFANQLASMYARTLGEWTRWLIATVAFITMFSTSLTVCDGYARTLVGCWRLLRAGRLWPETDATGGRAGYLGVLGALMLAGWLIIALWLSGLRALIDVATITAFLTAPVVGWLSFAAVRREPVPPADRPGRRLTWLTWAGFVYLIGFGLVYLVTQVARG
ncbi:MAG TPA: Nramp family divalent metal transporter [Candidatus Krumholzibacteria bacterium]|nr:Nramp family divalent metal transporter [Candidatus Krumholzibacteria bacterium]HPD72253.1 Nramp family divalent metal transporter [Candidatus Krumholzibacteria bacterium]HRY40815.1 Nramp family divalent metal transporter [Candidatus Krumholzibacteria bacterium]